MGSAGSGDGLNSCERTAIRTRRVRVSGAAPLEGRDEAFLTEVLPRRWPTVPRSMRAGRGWVQEHLTQERGEPERN